MAVYLAIDLGTTGCRSILFDESLNQIADCYLEYGLITEKENWVEQDANLWWELTLETAKGVLGKSGIDPKKVSGISVSSQGITLVPVDENTIPLCNAISWLDKRAEKQVEHIKADFAEREMFTLTGKPITPAYFLPKLLYVHADTWVTEGVISTAGSSMRWLRDVMYSGCGYDIINSEAKDALKRGSNLFFYPYLSGPSCPDRYENSTGCFYGANLATQRGDFALAVMEGIAFQTKIILEVMGGLGQIHTLVMFGGGAKSALWCQIMADVLNIDIKVPSTAEAAGAGAAILAGIASNEFERTNCPSLKYETVYRPGELSVFYMEKYKQYRSVEYKLWK